MGGKSSRLPGNGSGNLLEGSAWLRSVVQNYQKRRHGVSGFDSFVIEPLVTDINGIQHFRVSVAFRNSKGRAQQVFWMVKVAQASDEIHQQNRQNDILHQEVRVYTEFLSEIGKFLSGKRNQRARYLLNVPDLVYHDRLQSSGRVLRCHLVTEDVSETKRCNPLKSGRLVGGLKLGQFKVLLGTLAQFHAVGIAYSISSSDSILDTFPFLHKETEDKEERRGHLNNYLKLLQLYHSPNSRQVKLFQLLLEQWEEILGDNLKQDLCDVLGSICLGPVMSHEVMFQYENNFFDLCGVGGADNIIWNTSGNSADDNEDDTSLTPICAAVTTCHRVHFGHLLKELAIYFFTLPEALIRERYVVFLLQSYCHVLTMTLEMLDVNWGKHFGDLTFTKMINLFCKYFLKDSW